MNDNLDEFRDRATSVFRSLRPKNKKKEKKSGGSKSIFSSLLLANYEQQMQFDPTANFSSNCAFETRREVSLEITREKSKLKAKAMNGVSNQLKHVTREEECETVNDDTLCEPPDSDAVEKKIEVDPFIYEVYGDVLFEIIHHLNGKEDADNDLPIITKDSAFSYVKDAFGIPDDKHNEIFEAIKSRDSPEVFVDSGDLNDSVDDNLPTTKLESFCNFTPNINNFKALEVHCCLMKILLRHQLDLSQSPTYFWDGSFSFLARSILSLHAESKYLTETNIAFTQWAAFTETHKHHSLNINVFSKTLELIVQKSNTAEIATTEKKLLDSAKIFIPACFGSITQMQQAIKQSHIEQISNDQLKTQDELIIKMFWDSSKALSEIFSSFIGKLHEENEIESIKIEILRKTFEIFKSLKKVEGFDCAISNFENMLKESIKSETSKYLSKVVNKNILRNECDEIKVNELIKITQTANADCQKLTERFGDFFQENFNFSYGKILYKSFDANLTEIIKPLAIAISNTKEGHVDTFSDSNSKSVAKNLFELYMELKAFSDKGLELYGDRKFGTKDYFSWFSGGVDKWCEVSVFSALSRIQIAIAVDNLKPVTNDTKHSSSAVDTLTVLYSIKKFWEDLQWPDKNDTEKIKTNISGDICRFSAIYFDNIVDRVEKLESMKHFGIFQVPLEVCIVACNIEFISQGIQKLLSSENSEAPENEQTKKRIENTLKHGRSRAKKLIKRSIKKMVPSMRKLFVEGADVVKKEGDVGDRVIVYIDDAIVTFSKDLEEIDFFKAKKYLWQSVLDVFSELIGKSLELKREPIFYSNLKIIFEELQEIFKISVESESERIQKIRFLLNRHCLNTSKLIHQYFKDRYQMQQEISKTPFHSFGVLSIHCFFFHNVLKIEILNAKNLIPVGGNKKCDSFVKINIFPEENFANCQNYKTRVELGTHFPLYDERFEIDLTTSQRNMKDAIIFFNIKDKSLFANNQCIAEAFLSFSDIPEYSQENMTKQIHLTLTRLQSDDMESLKALTLRSQSGDKAAKDFLTKVKSKTVTSPIKQSSPVIQI